jgi:hypothetical protein
VRACPRRCTHTPHAHTHAHTTRNHVSSPPCLPALPQQPPLIITNTSTPRTWPPRTQSNTPHTHSCHSSTDPHRACCGVPTAAAAAPPTPAVLPCACSAGSRQQAARVTAAAGVGRAHSFAVQSWSAVHMDWATYCSQSLQPGGVLPRPTSTMCDATWALSTLLIARMFWNAGNSLVVVCVCVCVDTVVGWLVGGWVGDERPTAAPAAALPASAQP